MAGKSDHKPNIPDFNFRLPDNLVKQLTGISQSVTKMHKMLYGNGELQKLVSAAFKAQQNILKTLELIDINKILEGVKRITELTADFGRGISAHFPDNWSDSKFGEAASLCVRGIPVIFVPRGAVVGKLIKAKNVPSIKRTIAHKANAPLIIEDCEKALACDWLPKDMREHIQESITCFKNGQYKAAQSTAVIAFDSLLNDVVDMRPHRKKNNKELAYKQVRSHTTWVDGKDLMEVPLGRVPFYTVLMLPIIGHMLTDFAIGDRKTHLNDANRHASSHTISSKQYKKSNALLTIMAVASMCKVTQLNGKHWLQKSSEQYAAN